MPNTPPRPPRPPGGMPTRSPAHTLMHALTEFIRVATEALEEVLDEYRETRKNQK